MTIRRSLDNGRTWRNLRRVSMHPAAYSDLVMVNQRTLGILFETGRVTPYEEIVFRRIRLAS